MTRTKHRSPACGNPDCYVSTGIHEGMTFGSGELDEYGFWEFPCRVCAEAWDKEQPEARKHFKEEMRKNNPSLSEKQLDLSMKTDYQWLYIPGWPFTEGADAT